MERYPLDDETISLLAEIKAERIRAHAHLDGQRHGILMAFLRNHKLTGTWNVDPNERELVQAPAPQPAPQE